MKICSPANLLGVQVSLYHDRFLIPSASKQAIQRMGYGPDIIHSDQGSEFLAEVVTNFWEIEQQVAISASNTGSSWVNGYQASFLGRFREEFDDINRFNTDEELIEAIYSRISYYNNDRIHMSLKMPPVVYAKLLSDNLSRKRGS